MEKPIEVSILGQRLSNVYIDGVDSVALTHIVKMVEETANHLQETRHINSTHLKILYTAVYFAAQMYLQNKKVEEQKKQKKCNNYF